MSVNTTNEADWMIMMPNVETMDLVSASNTTLVVNEGIIPLTNSTNTVTTSFMIPIVGSNFNDILTGGFGNYYMDGAGGYDILDYSTLGQQITLGAQGFIDKGLAGLDQAANVEAIVAPVGFFNLIDGSTAGFNAALNVNLTTNSLQVAFTNGFALNFDIFNFVDVIGTSQDDSLIGNSASNLFISGAGNDYMGGSQGFDTLVGGSGYDIVDYSLLNQAITLGSEGLIDKGLLGIDQASDVEAIIAPSGFFNVIDGTTANGTAALNVNLSTNSLQVSLASGFSLDFDVFNFVDVMGTNQNDVIIGNSTDNILFGAAGNDYVGDFQGFDTLVGGTGSDIFAVADSLTVGYLGNSFATIADWNPFEDFLAINSTFSGSYSLGTGQISGGLAPDTLLFFGNDLVAVIQDSTTISATNILFA